MEQVNKKHAKQSDQNMAAVRWTNIAVKLRRMVLPSQCRRKQLSASSKWFGYYTELSDMQVGGPRGCSCSAAFTL